MANDNTLNREMLLPNQQWIIDTLDSIICPGYFYIDIIIRLILKIDLITLEKAVLLTLNQFAPLRAKFVKSEQWEQYYEPPYDSITLYTHNYSDMETESFIQEITATCISIKNSCPLKIEVGKLIQFHLFIGPKDTDTYLWVLAHHLLSDGPCFRILLTHIFKNYMKLQHNSTFVAEQTTISYNEMMLKLMDVVNNNLYCEQKDFWLNAPWKQIRKLDTDFSNELNINTPSPIENYNHVFSEDQTAQLLKITSKQQNFEISFEEILLSSFAHTLLSTTNGKYIDITTINNGRNFFKEKCNHDISRKIGLFALSGTIFFRKSDLKNHTEIMLDYVNQFKDYPYRGIDYQLLELLAPDIIFKNKTKEFQNFSSKVLFNYYGRIIKTNHNYEMILPHEIPSGEFMHPDNPYHNSISCTCFILNKNLILDFQYSRNIFKDESIKRMVDHYIKFLLSL